VGVRERAWWSWSGATLGLENHHGVSVGLSSSAGWPVLGGSNEYSGRPNQFGEVEDDR
jgi:hypothetical protein